MVTKDNEQNGTSRPNMYNECANTPNRDRLQMDGHATPLADAI